jgi:putative salt-induced outer membrane protein YdiY
MRNKTYSSVAAIAAMATTASVFAADPPPVGWQTTAAVNATVARGNADTLLLQTAINSLKKWDKNEVVLGADATYGNNRDVNTGNRTTTAQNYGGFGQYNRLIDDRWYFGLRGDARQDRIANVDYRATVAPTLGYYLIKKEAMQLKLEAGPAMVFEKLRGTGTQNYLTLRVAEEFRWKINDRASLVQSLEFLPQVDDFSNYVINGAITLDTKITEKLSTTITFQDFYRSTPAPGRKENDIRLLAGLAYKF